MTRGLFRRRKRIFVRRKRSSSWLIKSIFFGLIIAAIFLFPPVLEGAVMLLELLEP